MPASSQQGVAQQGKISWFGGPGDPSSGPTTSSGAPVSYPAISTYNQATKGGYWLVHMPNGKQAVLKQTDIGPAPWTGRNFDFTYTALPALGYSTQNFPTDANITATYLGKSVPGQYAHMVIGGGGAATSGPSATPGKLPASPQAAAQQVPVTTTTFDQAGYDKAKGASIAGSFIKGNSGRSPYDVGAKLPKGIGGLNAPNPLLSSGLLTTKAPNPGDYVKAQTALQQLAGNTVLQAHPAVQAHTQQQTGGLKPGGAGGGFIPQGGKYVSARADQGRDLTTNPGGPIIAPGNGYVVRIGSDPGGFGPDYPIVHFTSGPYAGRTMYVGHTHAAIQSGSFQAGAVLSHTGTHGVGNATVPGWAEIGFADGGSPGRFGQPTPFR